METLLLNKFNSVQGEVSIPGSKSLSNRALLIAALAKGKTQLKNLLISEDTEVMLDALKTLGVKIIKEDDYIEVYGLNGLFNIDKEITLDLKNAGTAMRPLTAILAISQGTFNLTGQERMMERPIKALVDALRSLNLDITYLKNDGYPPLCIKGHSKKGDIVYVKGNTSSQYLSALLMAAPLCKNGLKIVVDGDLISKPYIDLTIKLLLDFGAKITRNGYKEFIVEGSGYVSPSFYEIESDASSATYFIALGALAGPLKINGIKKDSIQGDIKFIDVLKSMGANIDVYDNYIIVHKSKLHGIEIDMNDMPDAAMTLVPLALFIDDAIKITNIESLRVKETDRIEALKNEMEKCSCTVITTNDSLYIKRNDTLDKDVVTFKTYKDHRMAMTLSLVSLKRDVIIEDPKCTEKTFPTYFKLFNSIKS